MKTFLELNEQQTEEKLKHLEHAEDHPINVGHEGTQHAINTLQQTANALRGKPSTARIMTKFDGSPSIVFGTHPETGQFFVSSKSAFNKEPKINYTLEDIQRNHGHAPGLVSKLSAALQHLPKVTPPGRIYQADIMHTSEDVKDDGQSTSFRPNTISYSTPSSSDLSSKIKKSRIGVAVHTGYSGKDFGSLKAEYGTDTSEFKDHPDVNVITTQYKPEHAQYSQEDHNQFSKHMQNAISASRSLRPQDYNVLNDHNHRETIKTYINSTVRNNIKPDVEGYRGFIRERASIAASKVKTDSAKKRYLDAGDAALTHVDANHPHFQNLLNLHHHLQQAKNVLVNAMSRTSDFQHHIAGQQTKPEGFVSVINNRPTKLTDRYEFNRMNFLRSKE